MKWPSEISTTFERLSLLFIGLYIITVGASVSGFSIPILGPAVGFVAVILVPGALFTRLIGIEPRPNLEWAPYFVGAGLVVTMLVWFMVNLAFLSVGIPRPLSTIPVATSSIVVSGFLLVAVRSNRETHEIKISVPTQNKLSPVPLLVLLLPLASVWGIVYFNGSGEALPLVAILTVTAGIPVVISSMPGYRRHLTLIVWAISLTILFHRALWTGSNYGGHTSAILNWKTAEWTLSGGTLLPNTILLPGMAHAVDLNILLLLKIFIPLVASILPVILYLSFRPWVGKQKAFLAACLFAFAHPFYLLYTSSPRAIIPVLFLGLIGLLISDARLNDLQKRILALPFMFGLAVSHYGTSYYVMLALISTIILIYGIKYYERISDLFGNSITTADGDVLGASPDSELSAKLYSQLCNLKFVILYTSIVIGWYLFVGAGKRYQDLLEHVINAYVDLLIVGGRGGSTAARLQADYGSTSIFYSKHLYLSIAALTGLGLAAYFINRIVLTKNTRFSDEYAVFASQLFVLFGGSFIISGEWGGGRPMMIVLSLGAVFTMVGVEAITGVLHRGTALIRSVFNANSNTHGLDNDGSGDIARISFALLIAVFFVINIGVVSAVALDDRAPAGVVSQDQTNSSVSIDINTNVWITDHGNRSNDIYIDQSTYQQITDWMSGEIVARSQRRGLSLRGGNLWQLNTSGVESGYVVLTQHNVVEKSVHIDFITQKSIASYDFDLNQRNKVYTTGRSEIYFTGEGT